MKYGGLHVFQGVSYMQLDMDDYKYENISDVTKHMTRFVSKKKASEENINVRGEDRKIKTVISYADELFSSKSIADCKARVDIFG